MKNLFLLLIVAFAFSPLHSQIGKVKVKKDIVSVDGVEVFKIETLQLGETMNVYNLDGEKLIILKYQTFKDRNEIKQANPEGIVRYMDVTFINDNLDKCEIRPYMKKGLAQEILTNNLIENGKLNEKAVELYIRVNGTKYSEQRNQSTTIIINH